MYKSFLLLALVILSSALNEKIHLQTGSDPVIVPLTMDQILTSAKEDPLKFQYYSLNLTGITIKSNQKLIISGVTSQHVFISLYINVINPDSNKAITDQLPSLFKNDIACYNQNVVSCVIMNPKQNSTIVIGVWAINNFSYMISPEIQTINSLKVYDEDVHLYFDSQFSQIYLLNLTQSYEETKNYSEIVIKGQYQGAADLDYSIFSMKACRLSKDKTTLSSNSCTKSVALGASGQYLKLQNHNQSFYLVITGQNTLHIGLSIHTPTSQIKLSQIIYYLYQSSSSVKQIKQFTFNINNDNNDSNGNVTNPTDIDYGVYIQKLTGDGIITLSACNFNHDINLQFGYSAYVIIPNAILICENPAITITLNSQNWKDIWQIGVRMIVQHYQQIDTDNNDILYLGQQRIQILQKLTQGCTNLSMQQLRTDYQQVMLLRYQTNIPSQTIILNTCQQQQCTNQTNIMQQNQKSMLYIKNIEQTTDLQLCIENTKSIYNNITYYYSILVLPFPQIKTVDLNQQILDIVNNNQMIVYMINPAYNRNNNNNVLKIQVKLINGDISMYDSCIKLFYDQDNLDNLKYECSNSQNSTAWRYYVSYNLDQYDQDSFFQLIKFGVRGNSQSLYSIYAYIQGNNPQPIPPEPIPTPDPTPKPDKSQILQDGLNKIIIKDKKSHIFLYNSHIIPYAIQLSYQLKSQNWCIQLFQSEQQLNKTDICSTSSVKLVQDSFRINTMYIRITSQQNTNITSTDDLQLTITPTIITLTTTRPSVLSCSKPCYTQVQIPNFDFGGSDQNIVVVYGPGYINNTVDGNALQIQFTSVPFIFTANLKQAGQLFIQIGGDGPYIISKNISVLQLVYSQNLQIIVPVNSLPTLLINSYGRNFTASWNLFTINISQYNTFSYYYADTSNPSYVSKYASSISPIILQNNQQNSVSPLCYWSEELSCFYTVSIKSNSKIWDILNLNNQVQINMESNLDLLFMNIPKTVTNYFGVKYHRVMLLKVDFQDHGKITNQFELVKQRISLQPISACGALEAGLIVADTMFGEKQGSNQRYLQVYSTQACMYNVAITQCTLPMTFTGLPRAITMNLTQGYQTLYRPTSSASELIISLWKNLTQSQPTSTGKSLIISVYSIQNIQNCTTQQNKLISTTIMNLKESIYKTTQLSSYIKISINQYKSTNLYLISITASQTTNQIIPLSLLITSNENQLILIPNSLPIPIMTVNSYKSIYNYYTNDNMWQLCYYLTNGADKSYNFTIDIQNNNLNLIQKQINTKIGQHSGCIDVNKINFSSNITKYQIILSSNTNLAQSDTIWLYTNQYVQSIQTNYPHTTIYQPQSLLLSTPNGKYGRCYSYDVTTIQSSINIIFYPQVSQQYFGNFQQIVSVQGKRLQYSISQIISVRTRKAKLYKIMIATSSFKENNVVACFSYPSGFFTKVIDEIDNFMVIFNQESIYRQITVQDSAQAIQAYKYVQLNVNRTQQNQWLVIQVTSCSGSNTSSNLTLLGSSTIQDIILGNIAQFDKLFNNFSILAGITPLRNNQFYIGLKHSGLDSFNYSITTYKTNSPVLPHSRWSLGNPKMSCTQSEDKKDLIVLLPQVTTTSNISSANIKYSIYAIPRANTTLHAFNQKSIRCPTFNFNNLNPLKIYNNTMTNPKIPLIKININQLPSKNVTIMGVVTIIQSPQAIPINYLYTNQNVQISQDGNEINDQSNSKSNMALLFLIIAIAIFLVLMSRLIYKIIKKRMSQNNVDFELQTRPAQSPAEVIQPQAQTIQINRTSVRQSIGYNQFVDQQVAV